MLPSLWLSAHKPLLSSRDYRLHKRAITVTFHLPLLPLKFMNLYVVHRKEQAGLIEDLHRVDCVAIGQWRLWLLFWVFSPLLFLFDAEQPFFDAQLFSTVEQRFGR